MEHRIWARASVVAATAVALSVSAPASAAQCGFDDVIAAYKTALDSGKAGNAAEERATMRILAEGGFAPAARNFAEDLASGQGGAKDRAEAARWAHLAALAGDATASMLDRQLGGWKDAATWQPRRLLCDEPGKPRFSKTGNAEPAIHYAIEMAPGLSPQAAETASQKLPELFAAARAGNPMAPFYLSLVGKIQVVPGDRYDRYIGWKGREGAGVLQVSVGNFLDTEPKYAAAALTAEIARRIYDKLPEAHFADPYVEVYELDGKKLKIHGTAYPDNSNVPFFRMTKQALRMVESLPPELRQLVEAIDEIRYNPPSKHFTKFGTLDATAAYYNRFLGQDGRRIIFIRRKVTYLSPLFLARSFVHEGTHAEQHRRAAAYSDEIPTLRAALASGKLGDRADAETKKLAEYEAYMKAWYQGVETENGRVQDIRFECEATINEIKAAHAIDAPPSVMKDSGYIKLCPEALKLMVDWQDGRLGAAAK